MVDPDLGYQDVVSFKSGIIMAIQPTPPNVPHPEIRVYLLNPYFWGRGTLGGVGWLNSHEIRSKPPNEMTKLFPWLLTHPLQVTSCDQNLQKKTPTWKSGKKTTTWNLKQPIFSGCLVKLPFLSWKPHEKVAFDFR